MNKLPQVYGLTLCDRVRVVKSPPSFNLDGVFLAREFARFPTPGLRFDAYACLFDGRGEGVIDLTCTQLEGERDIYYHRNVAGVSAFSADGALRAFDQRAVFSRSRPICIHAVI